jgi:hypothetical protein
MSNELEEIWKEAVMVKKDIIPVRLLPGGTEENYKTSIKIAGIRAEI